MPKKMINCFNNLKSSYPHKSNIIRKCANIRLYRTLKMIDSDSELKELSELYFNLFNSSLVYHLFRIAKKFKAIIPSKYIDRVSV